MHKTRYSNSEPESVDIFFHRLILKLTLINHSLSAMQLYNQSLTFINLILIVSAMSIIPFSAQSNTIYKSTDAAGGVTYSDTPTPDAKPIHLPSTFSPTLDSVATVLDGDTIVLKGNQHIRLLGINAPEISTRYREAEAGGIVAKKWLQEKLTGVKVYLEYDLQKTDHYNRSLAHVRTKNGEHINLILVEKGLAFVNLIPPNLRHADTLVSAQKKAEKDKLGIWAYPDYTPFPIKQIAEKKTRSWQRFYGRPISIKRSKKYSRLFFSNNIDIRIENKHLTLFPPLRTYLDKTIEVRGWVSRRSDHYSILIQHPSAIVIR